MLRGRLGLNLGLLALVLVLGSVAYFKPGREAEDVKPWLDLSGAQVSHVVLENGQKIVFEKNAGIWEMTTPFKAPVNSVRIEQLLDIGFSASEGEYPLAGKDLKVYGLDHPIATLTLGDTAIQFGSVDPLKRRRYVRLGDKLLLIKDGFSHHLNASATDYIDKKLLPEASDPVAIEIPGLKATFGQDGKWTSDRKPEGMDVGEWATLWSTARAIEVRRLEQPKKGDTIRINLKDGRLVEFTILSRLPELTLARKDLGLVFLMTTETSRDLLHLPKPEAKKTPAQMEEPGHEPDHQDLDP